MGGRLSKPRAADGVSEVSKSGAGGFSKSKGIINGRTVMAPLAALTMAGILFVYARTSIKAAKLNAQKHREADGGQISWHKESMRRHGTSEKVENDRKTFKEAFAADMGRKSKDNATTDEATAKPQRSEQEDELRKIMGKDK